MLDITADDRLAIHEVIALHGHLADDRDWDRLAGPGLLLLHAAGNVFVRDLAEAESILVESGSPVYWEESVQISMHLEYMRTPGARSRHDPGSYRTIWLRLSGPGRVAVQSVHKRAEAAGIPDYLAFPTTKRW